jgi:hypothetical protein
MCLNDEDCQLVLIAFDPSLPAYLEGLREIANVQRISKMMLLGSPNVAYGFCNWLDMGQLLEPASQPAMSSVDHIQESRYDTDEARFLPPSYSAVAKAIPPAIMRDDSKTPMARDVRNSKCDTSTISMVPSQEAVALTRSETVGKCFFPSISLHPTDPLLSVCPFLQSFPSSKESER